MIERDEVLDVLEVAALLRVGKNAVYDLVGRNKIPHRRVGRSIRFSRLAILAWLGSPVSAMVETCSLQAAEE